MDQIEASFSKGILKLMLPKKAKAQKAAKKIEVKSGPRPAGKRESASCGLDGAQSDVEAKSGQISQWGRPCSGPD